MVRAIILSLIFCMTVTPSASAEFVTTVTKTSYPSVATMEEAVMQVSCKGLQKPVFVENVKVKVIGKCQSIVFSYLSLKKINSLNLVAIGWHTDAKQKKLVKFQVRYANGTYRILLYKVPRHISKKDFSKLIEE
ncbi:MAG: hypothetical protein OXR68_08220 [Alphaproteobacteria bacterium]|nr:hypothetical protein [Alphaproteobacteria bacterium]